MSTMFADTVLIVFISVCTALLAEGITWVLVYRTEKYKRLKAEVEKQSKKLEKKKETITESAGRQQKKKIERQEEKLKNNNRDLSMVRMKSMFAIGFCFTALMGMFNSIFDGRVVAKLPFIPLSYIQGLSHRNLLGEDYTDCSFIFLYILCTMSIRQQDPSLHQVCVQSCVKEQGIQISESHQVHRPLIKCCQHSRSCPVLFP
uniref:Calcium load-activated calcium channel n=1 Tax=Gopherus agassizii TaxID=38772 RepID=A0A452HSQ5_9SAUR